MTSNWEIEHTIYALGDLLIARDMHNNVTFSYVMA
jgi:hypothetical protein